MARHARRLGIKVLFYISPQVWAWRPKRIHKIGSLIDHMAVIFKFEKAYYEEAGVPVSFVGHPLVDKVRVGESPKVLRQKLGFAGDDRIVGLFPGSRHSEISRLLPLLLGTAALMRERDPALRFLLPVAPTLDYDDVSRRCDASGLDITVSRGGIYEAIVCCDAIATCSGTVTLEIGLLGVPMCILYRMSGLSYQIMKRLITIPHIGLANIVAGRGVVREFLQAEANPQAVAAELFELIDNSEYRARVRSGLELIGKNLGAGDGARNMAQLVLSLIEEESGGGSDD